MSRNCRARNPQTRVRARKIGPNETVSEKIGPHPLVDLGPSCREKSPSRLQEGDAQAQPSAGEEGGSAQTSRHPCPSPSCRAGGNLGCGDFRQDRQQGALSSRPQSGLCATSTGNLNWLAVSLSNHGPGLGMRGAQRGVALLPGARGVPHNLTGEWVGRVAPARE